MKNCFGDSLRIAQTDCLPKLTCDTYLSVEDKIEFYYAGSNIVLEPYQTVLKVEEFENETSSRSFLEKIINKLKLNQSLLVINETEKYLTLKSNYPKVVAKIENKIIENFKTYSYLPSDHTLCLIANHVYCFFNKDYCKTKAIFQAPIPGWPKAPKENSSKNKFEKADAVICENVWRKLVEKNWSIHEILCVKGHQSIIYVNEPSKHLVLAYQSAKFKFETYFVNDLIQFINMMSKQNIFLDQLLAVILHVRRAFNLSRLLGYSISFTSYGFGSLFSDFSLFILHRFFNYKSGKSVTFESIGTLKLLNDMNEQTGNQIILDKLNIKSYCLEPNFINSCRCHSGRTYHLSADVTNRTSMNTELYRLLEDYSQIKNRPKSMNIFYLHGLAALNSYNLNEILRGFEANKTFHFVTAWPTFNSYKYQNLINLSSNSSNTSMNFDQVDLIFKNLTRHQIVSFVRSEYKLDVAYLLNFLNNTCKTVFTEMNRIKHNFFQEISYTINSNITNFNPIKDRVKFVCISNEPTEKEAILNESNAHFRVLANSDLLGESFKYTLILNHLYSLQSIFSIKIERLETSLSIKQLYEMFTRLESVEENLVEKLEANLERFVNYIQKQNSSFLKISQKFLEFYCDKQNELKNLTNLFQGTYKKNSNFKKPEQYTVISGKSGSGKTTQAFKMAQLMLQKSPLLIVKLIDASCRANILFDLKKIALELGFVNCSTIEEFKREWNMFRYKNTKMLFIFDNLKSSDDLDQLTEGFNSSLACLITSNDNFISLKLNFLSFFVDDFNKYDAKLLILKAIQKIDSTKKSSHKRISFFDQHTTLLDQLFKNESKISPVKLKLLIYFYMKYTTENQNARLLSNEMIQFANDNYAYLKEANTDAFDFLLHLSFVDGACLDQDFLRQIYQEFKFRPNFAQVLDYLDSMSFIVKISNEEFFIHESILSDLSQIRSFSEYEKNRIAETFIRSLTHCRSNELIFKQLNKFKENGLIDKNHKHLIYDSIEKSNLKERTTPKDKNPFQNKIDLLEEEILIMLDRLLSILVNGSNFIQIKYANLKDIASKSHDNDIKRLFLSKLDSMESESKNLFNLKSIHTKKLFDRVIRLINIVRPNLIPTSNKLAGNNSSEVKTFLTSILSNQIPTLVFEIAALIHNLRLFFIDSDGLCLGRDLIVLADQIRESNVLKNNENLEDFSLKFKNVYECVLNEGQGILENMIYAVSLMYQSNLEIRSASFTEHIFTLEIKVNDVDYVYEYNPKEHVKFNFKIIQH